MSEIETLLTVEEREQIRAPIERARTLPSRAFTDPGFYEFEKTHVLAESWMAIAFGASIPDIGDVFPMETLDIPILLIRGEDGVARAFHNICPYDGCEVSLRRQQGVLHIITPYHGWKYSLDGKLMTANFWDGFETPGKGFPDELNVDLVEIPCQEWLGTIFIYPGSQMTEFETANYAVIDHLSYLDLDGIHIGVNHSDEPLIDTLTIKSNWKTVYENYSPNVYHESFVHSMYRNSPHSPRVDGNGNKTYTEINDPSGYLGLCYDNTIGTSFYGESNLPAILCKNGSDNAVNTISNVFPNWVTTILGDTARISIFLPEGPGMGKQIVATFFHHKGARAPELAEDRMLAAKKGILARKEDNIICESIQRARKSPAFDSQFYSPFWDGMHYTLSNLILDRIERAEAAIIEASIEEV